MAKFINENLRDRFQRIAKENNDLFALQSDGVGPITEDVEKYLSQIAEKGHYTTKVIFSKDPIFKSMLFCRKTLEEAGLTIDLVKNSDKIVGIEASWDVEVD